MYDLYRRRRAAPNYDEYNPEDWSGEIFEPSTIPPADRPLASRDIPDSFPVEAEAGRASGLDAEAEVAATKAQLKSLVDDPDYWRHKKPDAVARVTRAFEAAYGGGPGVDATGKQIDQDPRPFNYAEFAPRKEKDEFGADPRPAGRATDNARNFLADGQEKRDNVTLSPAARTGGKTDVRDLLYRPPENKLEFHHRPYDPSRDKPDIVLAQAGSSDKPSWPPQNHRQSQDIRPMIWQSPLRAFPKINSEHQPARIDPFTGKPRPHSGIDLGASDNTDVFAAGRGIILRMGEERGLRRKDNKIGSKGWGKYIEVLHDDGTKSIYAHLSEFNPRWKPLAYISEEDARNIPIGKTGTTGETQGYHLHFEMWRRDRFGNWERYNPQETLRQQFIDAQNNYVRQHIGSMRPHLDRERNERLP